MNISVQKGDITLMRTEAIVNAANHTLLGGGGVDGAIHRAAGSGLLRECKTLNGCLTGQSKITNAHLLPAKHVIHTVGPVWSGGRKNECDQLASCYQSCLDIATKYKLRSISFPAISTGAYRFPINEATEIAVHTVKVFAEKPGSLESVVFVCFNDKLHEIYCSLLKS